MKDKFSQKLYIIPYTLRKANDFVSLHHRHNGRTSRDGGKFAIAAQLAGDVVGIAIVGNPVSSTYMDGFTAEVLRVCLSPQAPKNTNSFLYGACRRIWFEMGGACILTYTLLRESGDSLRGAGWNTVTMVAGHDARTWGKKDHLTRKEQAIQEFRKWRWESYNSKSAQLELYSLDNEVEERKA